MFKNLDHSDYTVEPYEGSKKFEIIFTNGSSESGVQLLEGEEKFTPFREDEEKNINGTYKRGVFKLIHHFYFKHRGNYEKLGVWDYNNIDTSHFHAKNTEKIWVLKAPRGIYGERIRPGSIQISFEDGDVKDDGSGNIIADNGVQVGNVFYQNGIIVFTASEANPNLTNYRAYKSDYRNLNAPKVIDFNNFRDFKLEFKNVTKFFEYSARCVIEPHEFNSTVNPTAYRPSGLPSKYREDSEFSPYITTIGLYDEENKLVAVGKLPNAVKKPKSIPLTIHIKFDL